MRPAYFIFTRHAEDIICKECTIWRRSRLLDLRAPEPCYHAPVSCLANQGDHLDSLGFPPGHPVSLSSDRAPNKILKSVVLRKWEG